MYSINQSTGELTSITTAVAAGTNPRSVAVDPTGRFAYVSNNTGNTVSMYSINNFSAGIGTFAGSIRSSGATSGIGYGTGAGGTVTQGTSRATAVTLNTVTGNIVLFTVAGNTTPTTFTLTNSAIANTDVVILNQRSGTNLYNLLVSQIGATGGNANITVWTTGGVTSEAPIINFAVIKGVAA